MSRPPFTRQVDAAMPTDLVSLICSELQLNLEEEVYLIPGMLALADLQSLPVRLRGHTHPPS